MVDVQEKLVQEGVGHPELLHRMHEYVPYFALYLHKISLHHSSHLLRLPKIVVDEVSVHLMLCTLLKRFFCLLVTERNVPAGSIAEMIQVGVIA